jgi:aminocarboxymuconate-semialdehyde decarboxylase
MHETPDPSSPRAIDLHSHIVTPDVRDLLQRQGQHFDTRIVERNGGQVFLIAETATRPINARILGTDDFAARLVDMDAEGVEREALTCVPFVMYPNVDAQRGLAVAQVHNDSVAAMVPKQAARFVGMASVPIQAPDLAARELERARGLGLVGVMIPPNVGERALDEPEFEAFWEAAEALDMAVFIHPFEAAPTGLMARYTLGGLAGNLMNTGLAAAAVICGGVLERHPRLRVLLAHAGGTLPAMLGRIDNGYPRSPEMQANLTRTPSSYLDQLWYDTIAFNGPFLTSLIAQFGADRFVIGSDYPVGGPAHPVGDVLALELPPEQEAAILRENALRLLPRAWADGANA